MRVLVVVTPCWARLKRLLSKLDVAVGEEVAVDGAGVGVGVAAVRLADELVGAGVGVGVGVADVGVVVKVLLVVVVVGTADNQSTVTFTPLMFARLEADTTVLVLATS